MESSWSCPIKCSFLKQESTFLSLPTAAILFAYCLTTTIQKSSILSHGINVSKNHFHNGIYFSHEIDSVKSMPGVLKSLILCTLVLLVREIEIE
jgi:hypothetical protein